MSDFILVKGQKNFADEFDTYYLKVWTKDEWNEHLKLAEKHLAAHYEVEVSFGSNEAVRYSGFESYKDTFIVTELTNEQAEFLQGVIPVWGFGQSIVLEIYDDEWDEKLYDEYDESMDETLYLYDVTYNKDEENSEEED